MVIEDKLLKAEANNLVAVRLILASSVIYTHSYWLVTGRSGEDDLSGILGEPISVFAVDGFFFLSGFLVYPSLLRLGQAIPFLFARLARLWPALLTSIVLTVGFGALATNSSAAGYFQGETIKFIVFNGLLLQGFFNLTDVRCGAELCVVNGSLWTLPWEARCYLLLAGLGAIGLAKPSMMKWVVLPASFVGALVWDAPQVSDLATTLLGSGPVYYISMLDRLWTLFVLGIAAYLVRDRLKLSWTWLVVLFFAAIATDSLSVGLHVRGLFIGYAVLCMGFLTASKRAITGRWPDYSYGMYIYAFPIMLVVNYLWPTSNYWLLAVTNAICTLPIAAFSWHCIEKPVLDASRLARTRRLAVPHDHAQTHSPRP